MPSKLSDWFDAGAVGRPHGLDGSFYVTLPRPELLERDMEVTLAGTARRIVRRAGTPARPIVRLEGCDDRDTAEALRGEHLLVPRDRAPALPDGEWWPEELAGCEVHDGGRRVGTVLRMLALPSCEVLEVEREAGETLLVPMVRDAVRDVDVAAQRIDVDLRFLGEDA